MAVDRNYGNDVDGAAVAAVFPGGVFEAPPLRDRRAGEAANLSNGFDVPAAANDDGDYAVALDERPKPGTLTVIRSSDSESLQLVGYEDEVGANQVGVDWVRGVLFFPSGAAGAAHVANYTGIGSVTLAARMNRLGNELAAVEDFLTDRAFAGEVVFDPVNGDDGWSGSRVAPVATAARVVELLEGMTGLVRVVIRGGATLVVPSRWDAQAEVWEAWPEGLELFFEGEGARATVVLDVGQVDMEITGGGVTTEVDYPLAGARNLRLALDGDLQNDGSLGQGRLLVRCESSHQGFEDCEIDLGDISGGNPQLEPERRIEVHFRFAPDGGTSPSSGIFTGCSFAATGTYPNSFEPRFEVVATGWYNISILGGVRFDPAIVRYASDLAVVAPNPFGLFLASSVLSQIAGLSIIGTGNVQVDRIVNLAGGHFSNTGNALVSAEVSSNVDFENTGFARLTSRVARGISSRAARFQFGLDSGDVLLEDFDVVETAGGNRTVDMNGWDAGSVTIRNGRFVYTGPWEENNAVPAGKVTQILYRNSTAPLRIDGVTFEGTCQAIYVSHPNPAVDPNRDTKVADVRLSNCDLRWTRLDDGDVDPPLLLMMSARGLLDVVNCNLYADMTAAVTESQNANSGLVRIQAGSGGFAGGSLNAGGVPLAVRLTQCTLTMLGRSTNPGSGLQALFEVIESGAGNPEAVNKSLDIANCVVLDSADLDVVVAGGGDNVTIKGVWIGPDPTAESGSVTWGASRVGPLTVAGDVELGRASAGVLAVDGIHALVEPSALVRGQTTRGTTGVTDIVASDSLRIMRGFGTDSQVSFRLPNNPPQGMEVWVMCQTGGTGFTQVYLQNSDHFMRGDGFGNVNGTGTAYRTTTTYGFVQMIFTGNVWVVYSRRGSWTTASV